MASNKQKAKGTYINGIFCPVATPFTMQQINTIYTEGLRLGFDVNFLNKVVNNTISAPIPQYDLTPLVMDTMNKMDDGQMTMFLNYMCRMLSDPAFAAAIQNFRPPNAPKASRKRATPSTNDDDEIIDVVGLDDSTQKAASSSMNSKRPRGFSIDNLLTRKMMPPPAIPLRKSTVIGNSVPSATPLDLSGPRGTMMPPPNAPIRNTSMIGNAVPSTIAPSHLNKSGLGDSMNSPAIPLRKTTMVGKTVPTTIAQKPLDLSGPRDSLLMPPPAIPLRKTIVIRDAVPTMNATTPLHGFGTGVSTDNIRAATPSSFMPSSSSKRH